VARPKPGNRKTEDILSILGQMEREKIQRKATLFFGARTARDLLYHDQLAALEGRLHNFKYIPTLSRPAEKDGWEGERGRVTNLIQKYVRQDAPVDVYMCGSPAMIDSCLEALKQKGIPEENIFFDKFE